MPSFNDRFEHRARLLKRLLAALFLSLGVASAWAQNFPSKSIRLIAPYPPGGFNDVTGRILAQALAERFGQSVIVENKPGASTIIGTLIGQACVFPWSFHAKADQRLGS